MIQALREQDIKIEEGMGSFGESDGIEKGRVKKTGTFDCELLLPSVAPTLWLVG